MSAPFKHPRDPLVSRTDLTVLYGLLKAMLKHDRKLVTLPELYPFCLQDPRNVRWTMSRLKNRLGLVTTQRIFGVGITWVWCGKGSLRKYLIDCLEDANSVRENARKKSHRMPSISEMLRGLKKMGPEPRSKTVHLPAEAA